MPVAECRKKTQPPATVESIAVEMGVSRKTLHRYYSRGCPRGTVSGAVQWGSENIRAAAQVTEASDVGLELRRAELEKTLETARSQRLKTDLLAGSLLSRVDVERDIRLALSRVVARLSSLGLECANVAPGEIQGVVKTVVEERVRIALKELSDGGLV